MHGDAGAAVVVVNCGITVVVLDVDGPAVGVRHIASAIPRGEEQNATIADLHSVELGLPSHTAHVAASNGHGVCGAAVLVLVGYGS